MNRRGFLTAIIAAPAIVKASSIMPIWTPKPVMLATPNEFMVIKGVQSCVFVDGMREITDYIIHQDLWVTRWDSIIEGTQITYSEKAFTVRDQHKLDFKLMQQMQRARARKTILETYVSTR